MYDSLNQQLMAIISARRLLLPGMFIWFKGDSPSVVHDAIDLFSLLTQYIILLQVQASMN